MDVGWLKKASSARDFRTAALPNVELGETPTSWSIEGLDKRQASSLSNVVGPNAFHGRIVLCYR